MMSVEFCNSLPPPPIYEPLDSEPASPAFAPRLLSHKSSLSSATSSYSSSISSADSPLGQSDDDESLPSYTPALTKKGVLQIKPELSSPFCRANRRNWRTAVVEVNNTQLKLTQSDFYGMGVLKRTVTYSLQFAEIGLASDYTKRPHCFRLRVETKQFVFDCRNRQEMLNWMVGLQMAISLALPLELRQLPEDTKRRRRRRTRERRRRPACDDASRQCSQCGAQQPSPDQQRQHQPTPDQHHNQHQHHQHHHNHRHQHPVSRGNSRCQHTSQLRCKKKPDDRAAPVKWQPARRQSRFSEKDFPHLFIDTTWEGKNVLYRGRWALVRHQRIIILAEVVPPGFSLQLSSSSEF